MEEYSDFLSLGWGVQSFTIAAKIALGELPPVIAAINSDTTHEREVTYKFAERWTPWLMERGVNVVTVRADNTNIVDVSTTGVASVPMPVFTKSPDRIDDGYFYEVDENDNTVLSFDPAKKGRLLSGGGGQLRRQCTQDWKIAPIRKYLRSWIKERKAQGETPHKIRLWIGISTDEAIRMKDSDVKYIRNHWPLIDARLSRNDCEKWLIDHALEVPPKSSCTFCPFHNMKAWRELKSEGGTDWMNAVNADREIRGVRPPFDLFIHPARIPLEEVDLRTATQKGQLELWANWDEECSGICGV